MRRSHKALLAEAADALVFGGVIGAPAEKPERKARTPKAKAKATGPKSKREDNVTRLETPNVQRAPSIEEDEETPTPDRVDDAYQKVFQALNTQGLESLLATQNDKLDKILLVLLRWWKWDRDQLREMIVESKKRQRLAQLEQTQADNAARQGRQGGGGGGFLEAMSDLFGGNGGPDVDLPDGPDGKKRKRRTRRQRTRTGSRGGRFGGFWRRTVEKAKTFDGKVRNAPRAFAGKVDDLVRAGGSRAMSALSSGGKLATLLGAGGALVYSGALNAGEDDLVRNMHEEEAAKREKARKPNTVADVKDELTPTTVKRTAQEAVDEVDAKAKSAKPNIKTPDLPKSAEKGLLSKVANAGKGVGNAVKSNAIISSAFAALDAYNIASDDTMTDKEKEKAYSGLAGSSAGGILGGMGAAAVGAAIGQVLIPIPGVGAAVGGAVAGIAGSYFGSEAGQAAGEMTYDIVVTQRDGEKASEEQDAAIKVDVKSPAIDKIAEAADKQERTTGNWFTRTFGNMFSAKTGPQSTPSNYALGGASSYAFSGGGSNYSYQTRNPAAGGGGYNGASSTSSVAKIDYASDPRYVQGQGVLKNLASNDKVESRLSNWSGLIEDKANKHGVDPLLVRSIMKQESGGKNDARSHAGAAGLMQLMPNTARGLGVNDSHDPAQNVEGGTKYISQMIKMFDGNVPVALAAYNWGPGNMQKLIKRTGTTDINQLMQHLPAETRGYVTNITRNHSQYKAQLDAQKAAETTKATDSKSTVDVARTDTATTERDTSEVKVDRTDTSDNIVAATSQPQVNVTVPPPAPDKKAKVKSATKESQKPPAMLARQSGASPTTLDDMPILIADHGLGSLLSGRI